MDHRDVALIESYVVASSDQTHLGLHELPGAIAARFPDASASEIHAGCRDAVASLIARGFVWLRTTPAHSPRPTRDDYLSVDPADTQAILDDPRSFDTPSDARPRYWVKSTPEGLAAFIRDEEVVTL